MSVQKTVVFTDLIGSTGVFESMGNARATEAVTQLTQWISDICVSHGGHVVKTLGDGVLAVFDSGQAAVNAVVEMQRGHQKRIASFPASMRMPIRIGVASGEVEMVAGDCFGDAVNVAARLSDLSGPHQIWANSAALNEMSEADGVRFRALGPITIRGRAEPVSAYQVECDDDLQSSVMTIQAELDSGFDVTGRDVLGAEIGLVWLDVKKSFKSFELPIHIGRGKEMNFVVNDPRVSRAHARIDWRNGSIMLVDVSTYGTWLRFAGGGTDHLLRREECVLHGSGEIALGAPFSDFSVTTVAFSVS
jgi:adenylate cyclase